MSLPNCYRCKKQPCECADGITLYCGDCREILPELEAASFDLVVTSPPYNLKKKWWDCGANGIHQELADKFANEWYDDEIPEEKYQTEQRKLLAECKRISRGSVCYNHKVRHAFKREGRTFHPIEWTGAESLWTEIIWSRGPGPAVNCRRPVMADERVFVFGRPVAWHDFGLTTIWEIQPNREQLGHPCAFPLELPRRLIKSFSDPRSAILDPYCGSGTTLRAAKDLDRKATGIEISEEYASIAANRLRQEVLPFGATPS